MVARGGSRNWYEGSVCVLVIHRTTTVYGGARAVPGTVVSTWFDVADIFAACGIVQSKIPQFGVADIFAVLLCKARYHNLAQWNCRTL